MKTLELTQFSTSEFHQFYTSSTDPSSPRERYMVRLVDAMMDPKFIASIEQIGGLENIVRFRVVGDPGGDPLQNVVTFEPVLKLPVNILAQKRLEAERARREREILEKAAELSNDPKKYDEFVRKVVAKILGRAMMELLLAARASATEAVRQSKKPAPRKVVPRKPLSKAEEYARAVRQDRRQRIEAARQSKAKPVAA